MLVLQNIALSFGHNPVLRDISLEVMQGEILCLLGPSGCGKTTLLRVIAGLEKPDSGKVLIDNRSILSTPVHRRGFGFMFQDFALFPHMDVAANVAFGLRMLGLPAAAQQRRVAEVLDLVNLIGFDHRDVSSLSGGERQRVALARSLAPNPLLLMLDEPLGSLDAALRDQLVIELRSIIKTLGLTTLYVTHDQAEAYAISDRIALMNGGRFEQIDTPQHIYRRPATIFVARFLGLTNIIPVQSSDGATAQTALGTFPLRTPASALLLHPQGLAATDKPASGQIVGEILEVRFQGSHYRINLRHASGIVLSFLLPVGNGWPPAPGDSIALHIDTEWIVPLQT